MGNFLQVYVGVNGKTWRREETLRNFLKVYVRVDRKSKWREEIMCSFQKFTYGLTDKLGGGRNLWAIF